MIFAPVSMAVNCQSKSALYGFLRKGNRKSRRFKRQETQTRKSTDLRDSAYVRLNYWVPPKASYTSSV